MELKHGYYHLIAILTVAIWGLTFISTKVLINHGLTPQEIFFYRFLIAYTGIWVISPKRLFTGNWKDELWLVAGYIRRLALFLYREYRFRDYAGFECIVYHLHGSLADHYLVSAFL